MQSRFAFLIKLKINCGYDYVDYDFEKKVIYCEYFRNAIEAIFSIYSVTVCAKT